MNVPGMINDGLNAPFTGPLLSDMTATENGVGEGRSHLTAKEIQDMELILRTGMVGYAYLYPHGEKIPKVYVFSMTPENIANFIGRHRADCPEMTLTDRLDMMVLTTYGEFIDMCPNQELLREVLQHLMPIQMGEAVPKDVISVTRDVYSLYDEMLEAAHMDMKMEVYLGEQKLETATPRYRVMVGADNDDYVYADDLPHEEAVRIKAELRLNASAYAYIQECPSEQMRCEAQEKAEEMLLQM